MKILISMAIMAMLVSCSTGLKSIQKLATDKVYKRDLIIQVNGQAGVGTLVVKKAKIYHFHIEAAGQLDLFTFKTCHREWDKQSAWNVKSVKKKFFWKKKIEHKKEIEFEVKLTDVELNRYCPSIMTGYERKGGRHSWGFVDFESDKERLSAEIHCNGKQYTANGVSICQSKVGTIQRIIFKNKAINVPFEGCPKMKSKDKKIFEFEMPKGDGCVYVFVEKGTGLVHRLTALGYESILIRGHDE